MNSRLSSTRASSGAKSAQGDAAAWAARCVAARAIASARDTAGALAFGRLHRATQALHFGQVLGAAAHALVLGQALLVVGIPVVHVGLAVDVEAGAVPQGQVGLHFGARQR